MVHKKISRIEKKSPARKTAARSRLQKKSVENIKQSGIKNEDIPSAYNVDTIVIMPVNVDRNFIYWEVTEALLNGKGKALDRGSMKLMIKVFDSGNHREVYSVQVNERIGKHYMTCPAPVSSLFAEIGTVKGKNFTGLIKSEIVSLANVSARAADQEVWMKRVRGSGKVVPMSDREINKIRTYNPYIQKHFQELQDLLESPFSSSTHLRKRR